MLCEASRHRSSATSAWTPSGPSHDIRGGPMSVVRRTARGRAWPPHHAHLSTRVSEQFDLADHDDRSAGIGAPVVVRAHHRRLPGNRCSCSPRRGCHRPGVGDLPTRRPGRCEIHFPESFLDGTPGGQHVQLGNLQQVARCPTLRRGERGPEVARITARSVAAAWAGPSPMTGSCSLIPHLCSVLLPAGTGRPFPG